MSSQRAYKGLYLFGSILIPVLIWWVLAKYVVESSVVLPSPYEVYLALVELIEAHGLMNDIWVSIMRTVAGFGIGTVVGIVFGMLTGRIKTMENTIGQIFQMLRPLTPVALAPFFILWLGLGESSKILLIAWGVFFPVWIASHIGVQNVEIAYIWAAKTLGFSRVRLYLDIYLKGSLPIIISGVRTGIAVSFILLFVSETLGASSGVGYRLKVSYDIFRIDRMFACLLILGFLGALSDGLFALTTKRVFPWLVENR